jgi:uncharacterized membrane protein YesL
MESRLVNRAVHSLLFLFALDMYIYACIYVYLCMYLYLFYLIQSEKAFAKSLQQSVICGVFEFMIYFCSVYD